MSKHLQGTIRRRDMLRALTAGAIAAAAAAAPLSPAQAETQSINKGRARYQANSSEVQTFYRVNRYPTQCGRRPC